MFGVWGLMFGVWGLGFGVWGLVVIVLAACLLRVFARRAQLIDGVHRKTIGKLRERCQDLALDAVCTSHVTRHFTHHTSHFTHHTSHVTSRKSHFTRHTPHHASRITHHTSHITHHTSHITHHITHHTSHVTRRITHDLLVRRHAPLRIRREVAERRHSGALLLH